MKFEILENDSKIRNKKVLGLGLFEDFTPEDLSPLPSSLALLASMEIPRESFKAKAGNSLVVPLADGTVQCIVLVGLGARDKACHDIYRRAAYKIVRTAAARGADSVAMALPNKAGGYDMSDAYISRAIGVGAALARYRFDKYKTPDEDDRFREPDELAVVGANMEALLEGQVYARCQCYARDLANEPGNVINPETFEAEARELAREKNFEIEVLGAEELAKLGMNALLAVGSGSKVPPRLIRLTYTPDKEPLFTAALVGKGLTFDSGGLSLKPADSMTTMKGDKTGACVVLGAIRAVADLGIPVKVHAIVGAAENMPGGSSYRPDDVIRAYNGKTIEVNNTDAEGRLTLADALAYACERKPDLVIDIATLTGACAVALGETTAGLFANDDAMAEDFLRVSGISGERFWRLPMDDENLKKKIKSPVADLLNSAGRYGGAITAAMFLENFVEKDLPWIHLDIAATDFVKEPYSYYTKGATAYGMRTIAAFLHERAAKMSKA